MFKKNLISFITNILWMKKKTTLFLKCMQMSPRMRSIWLQNESHPKTVAHRRVCELRRHGFSGKSICPGDSGRDRCASGAFRYYSFIVINMIWMLNSLGLSPTKFFIASDVFCQMDPLYAGYGVRNADAEINTLELVSIIPVDLLKLRMRPRNERLVMSLELCTGREMLFEFGGFAHREVNSLTIFVNLISLNYLKHV